ncbi:Dynein heavy chain 3, axonemal [Eumeta japonica]|uniref:Dynein heavy chain 3, axonemal n=1 Tax=Eumeta variegata TaxID=151549 RepID=A0A4C1XKM6_EUMVA|nr:Dynein heavy chain 3, axonemal [Eumeta japonica]
MEDMARKMDYYLEEHNAVSSAPMHLVMFRYALEHISRCTRVLLQDNGNLLVAEAAAPQTGCQHSRDERRSDRDFSRIWRKRVARRHSQNVNENGHPRKTFGVLIRR